MRYEIVATRRWDGQVEIDVRFTRADGRVFERRYTFVGVPDAGELDTMLRSTGKLIAG